jgi:uncharacterized membrane protein YvbJ
MAETVKCPTCGATNDPASKECVDCGAYLKSELECLRSIEQTLKTPDLRCLQSIDGTLKTIRRIAIWWLILSILAIIYGLSRIR